MLARPKGTNLVMTIMMMTNIVGQAEYTNLVMMMMSLRRTNNVGQARRHQPGENDDDYNAHGGRRQSLVPIFNLALFVAQFVAQGCNNHVYEKGRWTMHEPLIVWIL